MAATDVTMWSVQEVSSWLTREGLQEHVQEFAEQEIDGDTLLSLTLADLKDDIGIKQLGKRKRLLKCIDEVRPRESSEEGQEQDTSGSPRQHATDSRMQDSPGASAKRRNVEQTPVSPQHGMVIAIQEVTKDDAHYIILDEKTSSLVRPIQLPPSAPAWPVAGFHGVPIIIGSRVEYLPSACSIEDSQFPRGANDIPCTRLTRVEMQPSQAVHEALAPVAYDGLHSVWPNLIKENGCACVPFPKRSLIVVKGSIARFCESPSRADVELGGEVVRGLPVACSTLMGDSNGQSLDSLDGCESVVNRPGFAVLGALPPYEKDPEVLEDQDAPGVCKLALMGFFATPDESRVWCEEQTLLANIFVLQGLPLTPKGSNDAAQLQMYTAALASFLQTSAYADGWAKRQEDINAIDLMIDALSDEAQTISWKAFPNHNCLAIFKSTFQGCYPSQRVASYLIEPASCKGWKRSRSGFKVLAGGTMDIDAIDYLAAPANANDSTPQPVISSFCQLLDTSSNLSLAYSDAQDSFVTGASTRFIQKGRSVHWALLKTAIRFVLSDISDHPRPHDFYKQLLARFCLWLVERQVALLTPSNATFARIDITMEMLHKVAAKTAKVVVNDVTDLSSLEDRIAKLRTQIDVAAERKAKCDAARYLLPEVRDLVADDPSIDMPPMSTFGSTNEMRRAAGEARNRAGKNVKPLEIPLAYGTEATNLKWADDWLQWLQKVDAYQYKACGLAVLRLCEQTIFKCSEYIENPQALNIECLEQFVDTYRHVSDRFKNNQAVRVVEQRSREVLVVWVAFCLMHSFTCQKHRILNEYKVGLKPDDLKNLVLSEKQAVDAALNVHRYILKCTRQARWGEVFSLVDERPTYQLAEHFSRDCQDILKIWKQECDDAKARVSAHWVEVRRKQELAKHLREVISTLEEKRDDLQAQLSEVVELERHRDERQRYLASLKAGLSNLEHRRRAESGPLLWFQDCAANLALQQSTLKQLQKEIERENCAIKQCQAELSGYEKELKCRTPRRTLEANLNKVKQEIQQKQAELKAAEVPPPAVFQPLPSDDSKALAVLFFLFMPKVFRSLSRISFLAQQVTLPFPWQVQNQWDVLSHAKVPKFAISWVEYYNQKQLHNKSYHKPPVQRQGADGSVSLHSYSQPPGENAVCGDHVDSLTDESQGVWYPDSISPQMGWRSTGLEIGRGQFINPFCKIPSNWKTDYFTEKLPEFAKNLQWAMSLPDSISPDRANKAIAYKNNCNERPDWLSKPAYEAFIRLRAYPNMQFRKLCVALQEDSFPLTNTAVHALIRQCLFQIGPIKDDSQLQWRTDDCIGGLNTISQIIQRLAEEHLQKSRSHEAMLILGELAAYISQWDATLADTSRNLAKSCLDWARDLKCREVSEDPARSAELKDKQRLFSIYSLLSYSGLDLQVEDAGMMCEAMVRIHNCKKPDEVEEPQHLKGLLTLCEDVMSRKIGQIVSLIGSDPSICTAAIRGALEHVPENLTWQSHRSQTACFEALSRDGHLYSVNLFRGIALLDGYSPTRLPSSIVNHPLYSRTFGSITFDVTLTSANLFKTTHAVNGCFYEFAEAGDGLMISEIKEGEPKLELQDPSSCCAALPVRLRKLHSHWFCPEQGLLLCRPINFQSRTCSYLVVLNEGACIQVPEHCKHLPVRQLVESQELTYRLVPHHSAATEVLSKFEDPAFIHAFCCRRDRAPNPKILKIELARYRLSFKAERGQVWSCDYRGYRLAPQQQLSNTLPHFYKYLVLERDESADCSLPSTRFLMPDASVKKDSNGNVDLSVPTDCGAECSVLSFEVHPRFGYFRAESVNCRLQLAALHVATSTRLPERTGCGLTGVEAAMMLVRHCQSSRPLTRSEAIKLNDLRLLCAAAPGLELLCHDIKLSSQQLGFLHGHDQRAVRFGVSPEVVTAYMHEARLSSRNFRRLLTVSEEQRILGVRSDRGPRDQIPILTELSECPISAANVMKIEKDLQAHIAQPQAHRTLAAIPTFPFSMDGLTSKSEKQAMSDLEQSWIAHHKLCAQVQHVNTPSQNPQVYQALLKDVVSQKDATWQYLMAALSELPQGYCCGFGAAERIRRTACIAPCASVIDITCMALRPDSLHIFNPFLSPEAQKKFIDGVFAFLLLCVLEDKVKRLCSFAGSGNLQLLLKELQVSRIWDVREHPQWLVFEVEGGLQIRPVQFKVAKFLIDDPGKLVQLNMGEGKTRVIVPMLVLYWATGGRVIRLHVLSSLIHEMYDLLHASLCASLLGRKIVVMPFHRDIQPTAARLDMMCHVLEECRTNGDVLLVAPEHRLSLLLKQHECQRQNRRDVCKAFEKLVAFPMRDIFDESDEILRHRYQLIYAVGGAVDLPHAAERWSATQAILRVIKHNEKVADVLGRSGFAHREPAHAEAFDVIRLISDGNMDNDVQDLYFEIVDALLTDPPYEFAWLKHYQHDDQVQKFLTNSSRSLSDLPRDLSEDRGAALLAFRGLLACGVLRHCLEKRHHVDYGVNPNGKKRLAVPFRASNTPSERSEYGHPDSAIVLTILSYYYTGLSRDAVRAACDKLLQLGTNEQQDIYKSWFSLSQSRMPCEDARMIDVVEKLDLSNEMQVNLLHKYYKFNMETVNFWLNHCVFPIETKQYPKKLVGNAWHLVDNKDGCVHGFSGTNDNQRLLPLQVKQSQVPELVGTNGAMLDLLLQSDNRGECAYHTLHSSATAWKAVLDQTLSLGLHALIDCGALTVGASGREIAEYLLYWTAQQECSTEVFQGVLFFDADAKQWMILDRTGRCLGKDTSPIQERNCFAYFDEARSRGTDLKLKQDAIALVTIGPKMNKDKLMQAAGRMRMLGRGQTLRFLGSEEVTRKMCKDTSRPSVKLLLQWVMRNSITAEEEGLPEWARQGGVFTLTRNVQDAALPESLELKDYYSKALQKKTASDIIETDLNKLLRDKLWRAVDSANSRDLVEKIRQHGNTYGTSINMVASVHDDEYERELEREVQKEQEIVKEVRQVSPAAEIDWRYDVIFNICSLSQLPIKTLELKYLTGRAPLLAELGVTWPKRVRCTQNFVDTIKSGTDMGGFLRSIDMMLTFPSGECLLLSDREADAILALFWKRLEMPICSDSVHLICFRLYCAHLNGEIAMPLVLPPTGSPTIDVDMIAILQMFMGDTSYPVEDRRHALAEFLSLQEGGQRAKLGRHAAMQLLKERGTMIGYERSDLAKMIASLQ